MVESLLSNFDNARTVLHGTTKKLRVPPSRLLRCPEMMQSKPRLTVSLKTFEGENRVC